MTPTVDPRSALQNDVRADRRFKLLVLAAPLLGITLLVGVFLWSAFQPDASSTLDPSATTYPYVFPSLPALILWATLYRRKPKGSSAALYVAAFPLRGAAKQNFGAPRWCQWTMVVDDGGARLERRKSRTLELVVPFAEYETLTIKRRFGGSYLGLVRDDVYVAGFSIVASPAKLRAALDSARAPHG